jgi:hypothetical protein
VEEAVTAAPHYVRTFDVAIDVSDVKIDESGTSAEVTGVAQASALTRDGDRRRDKRAVGFQFVKRDGEWLISTVSVWSKEDAPQ